MKIVLTYHSISDTPLSVDTVNFASQMQYLSDLGNISVVPLTRLFDNTDDQVAITFDDCFLDCYNNAVPVLLKHKFPATFFAVTGYDEITMWGSEEHQRWSKTPDKSYNIPFKFCTSAERRALSDYGFEIGSHTVTHRNLDGLSEGDQLSEINYSTAQLSEELGQPIRSFCFPRGRFSSTTLSLLDRHPDLEFYCTTKIGYADNPKLVSRFGVSNNFEIFKSIISGNCGRLTLTQRIISKLKKC